MKNKETVILVIATLTLVELTLLTLLAYHYYQQVQPELAGVQSAGSSLSNLWSAITGKKPAA